MIEAADLDEAVAIVAQAPCAVAHGVVEVWPLDAAPGGGRGRESDRPAPPG